MQNDTSPSLLSALVDSTPLKASRPQRSRRLSPSFIAGLVVAGVGIFVLGIFVGQGRINFLSHGFAARTGLSSTLDYPELDELYQTIRQNYDGKLTTAQIMDGLKHGMAESTGDPYTEYMSKTEASDFQSSLQGTISGIGAKLELDDDGNVIIAAPLAGSPAEAAGLRAKDVIISIDGKSASGLSATEAVQKIRGKKGTKVSLTVVRDKKQQLDFTITRDTIKIPTVVSKTLDGNIGYLQVSQFSDDTDELVQSAVEGFNKDGVNKIILDLRDNPGGEVTTAVNLSSLWLDRGDEVVQERRGTTVISTENATGNSLLKGKKTVVLINAGSASASEITALALRDHGAATLIGEKSYGKGVVQQLFPFDDGSSLKVTIAKWYSPKGTNIDKKGITPDQIVKLTDDDYKNGTDPQLTAAESYLNK